MIMQLKCRNKESNKIASNNSLQIFLRAKKLKQLRMVEDRQLERVRRQSAEWRSLDGEGLR